MAEDEDSKAAILAKQTEAERRLERDLELYGYADTNAINEKIFVEQEKSDVLKKREHDFDPIKIEAADNYNDQPKSYHVEGDKPKEIIDEEDLEDDKDLAKAKKVAKMKSSLASGLMKSVVKSSEAEKEAKKKAKEIQKKIDKAVIEARLKLYVKDTQTKFIYKTLCEEKLVKDTDYASQDKKAKKKLLTKDKDKLKKKTK